MSNQGVSTVPVPPSPATKTIARRSATYHPSIWGDYFISHSSDDATLRAWKDEAEILKQRVRRMLTTEIVAKPLGEKLNLIDAIQRSGISYHFEGELSEVIKDINNCFGNCPANGEHNLHITSLLFRLLREHGYNVSCDIFSKLKDRHGICSFNEYLTKIDLEGMLSLYEATHLRVHGETILDEAFAFLRTNLQSMVSSLDPLNAKQVLKALGRPIRKSLTRLEAREYISFYQGNKSHNDILLRFAKLDFNILQDKHRQELSTLTKWWRDLDFSRRLPFARDRLAECYLWVLGVCYEPQYTLARKFLAKVFSWCSVVDDIYDNYGVTSELDKFTEAIDRWEISAMDTLPEYMKICYQALLDIYDEMEEEVGKEGRAYAAWYAKDAIKNVVKAYHEESKWLENDEIPAIEEYMKVALVSTGYPMLVTALFVGMGEIAGQEAFAWLLGESQILKAACVICRIMSDIVSHEFEQQRGHIPSAVECYMNQYGVSKRQTCIVFDKLVEDAWKDINQSFLDSQAISKNLLMRILNFARVIDLLYFDKDHYTNASTIAKQSIALTLVDPVEI